MRENFYYLIVRAKRGQINSHITDGAIQLKKLRWHERSSSRESCHVIKNKMQLRDDRLSGPCWNEKGNDLSHELKNIMRAPEISFKTF